LTPSSAELRQHGCMAASARFVQPPGLATGVPYSYAAVVPGDSRLVFLAGACPLDAEGRTVGVGDVPEQAAVCMRNVGVALAVSEVELTDVVFLRVLVASAEREDLALAWDVVHRAFEPHEPPGTLQGVTVLGWEDQLVEVEVIAAASGGQGRTLRG
jgi:enamine deaminase RidA (YjgF/YER057c/UK114 family)